MTVTAIIADDEPLARRKLGSMLEKDPEIRVVERCRNAREAIAAVRSHHPDLLFLDIRMPDGDDFQVLEEIPKGPAVVLTPRVTMTSLIATGTHASGGKGWPHAAIWSISPA